MNHCFKGGKFDRSIYLHAVLNDRFVFDEKTGVERFWKHNTLIFDTIPH